MKYTAEWYPSPLTLPEMKQGTVEIKHRVYKPGSEITVVGHRQALVRGIRPTFGKVEELLTVHQLWEGDTLWMTDEPEELNQIAECLFTLQPRGSVLVGGLGLGLMAHTVHAFPYVNHVTVVEKNPDIIALCRPKLHRMVTIEADIADYLRCCHEGYDYILLDTWGGTNEGTWWHDVMPLKRIIRNRFGGKPVVHCWAEDMMEGQIVSTMSNPATKPHWYYSKINIPMHATHARRFVRNVGMPAWERAYGAAVDHATAGLDSSV